MAEFRKPTWLDLLCKAEIALEVPELVRIVLMSDTPSSAKRSAEIRECFSSGQVVSTENLARIKRDYPDKFWSCSSVLTVYESLDLELKQQLPRPFEASED